MSWPNVVLNKSLQTTEWSESCFTLPCYSVTRYFIISESGWIAVSADALLVQFAQWSSSSPSRSSLPLSWLAPMQLFSTLVTYAGVRASMKSLIARQSGIRRNWVNVGPVAVKTRLNTWIFRLSWSKYRFIHLTSMYYSVLRLVLWIPRSSAVLKWWYHRC